MKKIPYSIAILVSVATLSCIPLVSLAQNKRKVKLIEQGIVKPAEQKVVTDAHEANVPKRKSVVTQMVNKAATYFRNNTVDKSCFDFGHNAQWRNGEIFIFVIDSSGNVLVHGDDTTLIWKSFSDLKGSGGKPLVAEMLSVGKQGGWVNYKWYNGFKAAYVKTVSKDNLLYIVGAGFFPFSQEYITQELVESALASFANDGKDDTFALISNAFGPFVNGDIYLFVYDFEGNNVAHGDNTALIGQNLINLRDSRGKLLIKDLIKVAQSPEGKGWVDYEWKNEAKRSYVSRVVDPATKKPYLISGGYHPNIDQKDVFSFVQRGIRHLKSVGSKAAFADFSNPVGDYVRGPLTIFVYDLEGKNLADGENPGFVGQNLLNRKDAEGKLMTKAFIDQANKSAKGLVPYFYKNARKLAYVEKIEVPDGTFIIGSGYYPDSKQQATESLVTRATEFLKDNDSALAFRTFGTTSSDFYRGDLNIFVYLPNGTCLVNGVQTNIIWHNFSKTIDDSGKIVIPDLIALANAGGGWATYRSRNATRRVLVRAVEKTEKQNGNSQRYIVGSGYFIG